MTLRHPLLFIIWCRELFYVFYILYNCQSLDLLNILVIFDDYEYLILVAAIVHNKNGSGKSVGARSCVVFDVVLVLERQQRCYVYDVQLNLMVTVTVSEMICNKLPPQIS